jgi:hypothetical protein
MKTNYTGRMMQKWLTCLTLFGALATATSALALEDPDKPYLRRFPIKDNFTAIIEYVDPTGEKVVGQRLFSSPTAFKAGTGPTISLQGVTLNLYGLSACRSADPIQVFIYQGPCNGAAPKYITDELEQSPILLCRAFVEYAKEAVQDATCSTLYTVANVSIIHNFESSLLRVGAVTLTRDDTGKPLRPDLEEDEDYAKEKETLLWNPQAASAAGLTP